MPLVSKEEFFKARSPHSLGSPHDSINTERVRNLCTFLGKMGERRIFTRDLIQYLAGCRDCFDESFNLDYNDSLDRGGPKEYIEGKELIASPNPSESAPDYGGPKKYVAGKEMIARPNPPEPVPDFQNRKLWHLSSAADLECLGPSGLGMELRWFGYDCLANGDFTADKQAKLRLMNPDAKGKAPILLPAMLNIYSAKEAEMRTTEVNLENFIWRSQKVWESSEACQELTNTLKSNAAELPQIKRIV